MPHIGCRSTLSNGLVLTLTFAAWGCTAIGYAIGAASDDSAMNVLRPRMVRHHPSSRASRSGWC